MGRSEVVRWVNLRLLGAWLNDVTEDGPDKMLPPDCRHVSTSVNA